LLPLLLLSPSCPPFGCCDGKFRDPKELQYNMQKIEFPLAGIQFTDDCDDD
jgi:hypothetical protein